MNRQSGMTLLELLGVLALIGIVVCAVVVNMQSSGNPLDVSTSLLEGQFRAARLNAIATMSAYRVSPATPSSLRAEKGATCSATTWTVDSSLNNALSTGVTMSPSSWSVCYSSRGIATANVVVTLAHSRYGSRRVEVLVGGASRVLP
jgi:prepilin-type N-terminal cleavage/methylation domain-containing protein